MQLSTNTLILAIKSVQDAIKKHEELLQDKHMSEKDADYYGQYILDLTQALSELGGTYQIMRKDHPELTDL